jgi:phosphatidylglycerophosphate synthase
MRSEREAASENDVLRRPIQARNTKWAAATARWLGEIGLRPNHISLLSIVFGGLAAFCLFRAGSADSGGTLCLLYLGAAVGMQLRLLCNLFDGMVAVEGGFKTKSGEVFNEIPDRISDVAIFLAAGYSFKNVPWLVELGWSAALLSVLTAYIRAFGGAAGARQYFCGPMAKQQRMAVMTAACLGGAGLALGGSTLELLRPALALVGIGCVVTIFRRLRLIIADLEAR